MKSRGFKAAVILGGIGLAETLLKTGEKSSEQMEDEGFCKTPGTGSGIPGNESGKRQAISRDLRKLIEYMQQFNEEKWNRMQKTEENSQDKLEDMEKLIKMLLLNELSDDLEKGLKERNGKGL